MPRLERWGRSSYLAKDELDAAFRLRWTEGGPGSPRDRRLRLTLSLWATCLAAVRRAARTKATSNEFLVACTALDVAGIRPEGRDDDDDFDDFDDNDQGEPASEAPSAALGWAEDVRVMSAVRREPRPLLRVL